MKKDTSPHIQAYYLAWLNKKSPAERLAMAIEQCESVKKIIENRIKSENPFISDVELKVKIFESYYSSDFSKEKLEEIKESIRLYPNLKK